MPAEWQYQIQLIMYDINKIFFLLAILLFLLVILGCSPKLQEISFLLHNEKQRFNFKPESFFEVIQG